MKRTFLTLAIAGAVGIAAVLSTSHLLDDHSADWNHSTALADAQRAAQLAATGLAGGSGPVVIPLVVVRSRHGLTTPGGLAIW